LHLNHFRNTLGKRPPDALVTLLTEDARFRDPKTSADAYANAWALNYYLLRVRRDDYVRYLQEVAQRKPLVELTADQRLERFRRVFGDDLQALDQDLVRHMLRLR
jgi:hypothetical protein